MAVRGRTSVCCSSDAGESEVCYCLVVDVVEGVVEDVVVGVVVGCHGELPAA